MLEVGAVSGQYGSPTPRRELYRLLLALVLVPSPRWPPSLSCAVSIFSHGRRDRNIMVSERPWSELESGNLAISLSIEANLSERNMLNLVNHKLLFFFQG